MVGSSAAAEIPKKAASSKQNMTREDVEKKGVEWMRSKYGKTMGKLIEKPFSVHERTGYWVVSAGSKKISSAKMSVMVAKLTGKVDLLHIGPISKRKRMKLGKELVGRYQAVIKQHIKDPEKIEDFIIAEAGVHDSLYWKMKIGYYLLALEKNGRAEESHDIQRSFLIYNAEKAGKAFVANRELGFELMEAVFRNQMKKIKPKGQIKEVYLTVCEYEQGINIPLFNIDPSDHFMARFKNCKIPIRKGSGFKVDSGNLLLKITGFERISDTKCRVKAVWHRHSTNALGGECTLELRDGKWVVVEFKKLFVA